MKVRFLDTAVRDLDWFFAYYQGVFPAGLANAQEGYFRARKLLEQSPFAGQESEQAGIREFPVIRTPFQFIYRVTALDVQVIRVWDSRSKRPQSWT